MNIIKTVEWKDDKVILLDQRKLPGKEIYKECDDYLSVAQAIENMTVRGAPAIGVAAGMAIALGAMGIGVNDFDTYYEKFNSICKRLSATRPTAVNLFWAIERMKVIAWANKLKPTKEITELLKQEALKIYTEDIESCKALGKFGQKLLPNKCRVLTHCNAGALATAGYGTALGVIYSAQEAGKQIEVIADETRPLLQGARLTAWELQKHGIKVTVITDNMAASLMKKGIIDAVIVGADRIASNGDTANKIGTYGLALAAKYHEIPFYVAAPTSTIDMKINNGDKIPIEERDHEEVKIIGHTTLTPEYVNVINPAFDVTSAELITAIITEKGVTEPPFEENLVKLFS